MGLDPLIQLDQGLQLGCVEGTSLLELDTPLERLASKTCHHIVQVCGELVAQTMVDVQFALTRRRKVGVVDLECDLNQCFVVTFHGRLARGLRAGTGGTGGLGARSDAEFLLEILDLEPKRQVLFAEVFAQELAETTTE